jgi:hypothetical protein
VVVGALVLLSAGCVRSPDAQQQVRTQQGYQGSSSCTPDPAAKPLLRAQRRDGDLEWVAGVLGASLQKNERETFSELEIKYQPRFHIVAYFTRDGERTVRPYVRCTRLEGHVEVVRVEATISELDEAQDEAGRITDGLGIRADSDINIQKNCVEVYTPHPERLKNALRRTGQELPEHVVVVKSPLARPG